MFRLPVLNLDKVLFRIWLVVVVVVECGGGGVVVVVVVDIVVLDLAIPII